jgi:iduronate 2-sulfatase
MLNVCRADLRPQLGTYQPEPWAGKHVEMHTPALDAFANRSMVFLRSYCQQAICMASRASLLTGRRPDTTGVTTALSSYWRKAGGNFTSLPEHFKNHGYVAVGHGKSACCDPHPLRLVVRHG